MINLPSNKEAKILISHKKIIDKVRTIAHRLNVDYKGKHPTFICVLNGAFYFMGDLLKFIKIPYDIDFIKLSSYKNNTQSSGRIEVKSELSCDIKNKDIIIIEDIIDTRHTINFLLRYLKLFEPKSIKVVFLLIKDNDEYFFVDMALNADYFGFKICNNFVIGYGLDLAQKYRNLKDIYKIIDKKK